MHSLPQPDWPYTKHFLVGSNLGLLVFQAAAPQPTAPTDSLTAKKVEGNVGRQLEDCKQHNRQDRRATPVSSAAFQIQ